MTVTIHPRRGQRLTDLVRELIALAGGDRRAVTCGRGGVLVGDTVAVAYLTRDTPAAEVVTQTAIPPNLHRLVQRTEQAGGLHQPVAAPATPAVVEAEAQPTTTRATPRKRAPRTRVTQPTTEAVHV